MKSSLPLALISALLCFCVEGFPVEESVLNGDPSVHTKTVVKRWMDLQKLWKMPITYKIDETIPDSLKTKIRMVVEQIEAQTSGCIHFEELSGEEPPNFLHYKPTHKVWECSGQSAVGQNDYSPNYIVVNTLCFGAKKLEAVLLHETLHALGLQHEFGRPDRNKHVRTHLELVKDNMVSNYDIHEDYDTFNLPFDFGSVMMYSPTSMAKFPGLITMDPVLDANYTANYVEMVNSMSRFILTDKDVKQIERMYHCS